MNQQSTATRLADAAAACKRVWSGGAFYVAAMIMVYFLQPPPILADAIAEPVKAETVGVKLWVYKKWIGASGAEANVEIRLACPGHDDFEPRLINRDRPNGWIVQGITEDGLLCNVAEVKRDTFIADERDCLNLLLVPGQDVECTMVNTKVVKRIDMLNRYGLGLMIAVMLTVGLMSVKKLGRF